MRVRRTRTARWGDGSRRLFVRDSKTAILMLVCYEQLGEAAEVHEAEDQYD